MIRCIAVDDEPLALELIGSYIARTPFLEFAGGYTNAFDALERLRTERVELLFLDIQMPDITGLDVASVIDPFRTKIVFTTAFDSYALEGFRVDAVDYLLKPVSYNVFLRSVQKVRRMIESPAPEAASLVVKSGYRLIKIDCEDILYLESLRDYVAISLADGSEIRTLSTLKALEASLPCPPFLRVHRSFVVNTARIKILERNCIVFGKKLIPVSEAWRETILAGMKLSE